MTNTTDTNDPTNTTMTNVQIEKEAIFNEAFEIGRREGRGKTARMALIELVVARAQDGPLEVTDAEALWQRMMQGSSKEMDDVGGADPKDTKQRASDIKHFITLGNNKYFDAREVVDNAKQRMKMLRSSGAVKNARLWEMMLSFAREQNAGENREKPLTDAEIDDIFADPTRREREVADQLSSARQILMKANEGKDLPLIYDAVDKINLQIKELGGTSKDRRVEAAKLAKLEKKAAAGDKDAIAELAALKGTNGATRKRVARRKNAPAAATPAPAADDPVAGS